MPKCTWREFGIDPNGYPGSDELSTCGVFIGVHMYRLSDAQISYLANTVHVGE